MILVTTELADDFQKFRDRRMGKILKKILFRALRMWHEKFAKLHFERTAYSRYPWAFRKKKKRGKPLVLSGHLKGKILARKQLANIRGTSRKARIELKYGRPEIYEDQDFILRQVFTKMAIEKIDFKTAQRRVYSSAGYSKRAKDLMEKSLTAVNQAEEKEITELVQKLMAEELSKKGPIRRRKHN